MGDIHGSDYHRVPIIRRIIVGVIGIGLGRVNTRTDHQSYEKSQNDRDNQRCLVSVAETHGSNVITFSRQAKKNVYP
jgi:hypothetical protein